MPEESVVALQKIVMEVCVAPEYERPVGVEGAVVSVASLVTVIFKDFDTRFLPSETLSVNVCCPTWLEVGVHEKARICALNEAPDGKLVIE